MHEKMMWSSLLFMRLFQFKKKYDGKTAEVETNRRKKLKEILDKLAK